MLENGFIKLYRSLLKWEWYDDVNTKVVFLHLLLTVSIEDSKWHGITVRRGSRVSSYAILAKETKLSVDKVRTAIRHLEATGEVTRSKYTKYTVFAINHFDKFQSVPSKFPESSQGRPKVSPGSSQQYKKVKEDIEKVEEEKEDSASLVSFDAAAPHTEESAGTSAYREYLEDTLPESMISSGLVDVLMQAHTTKSGDSQ